MKSETIQPSTNTQEMRLKVVREQRAQGANVTKAMTSAGYAHTSANSGVGDNKSLVKALNEGAQAYQQAFARAGTLGADKIREILEDIIKTGRNFDKISAIKVMTSIIMRPQWDQAGISTNTNIFIIPEGKSNCKTWESKADSVLEAQVIQTRKVETEIKRKQV